MEIRQIIYFLALCEELHFTRAARRCGVAQPSLTNAIRMLEREFGAPLFHRKPRPRLSELGSAVRADLQSALVHLDRAVAHARRGPPQRRMSGEELFAPNFGPGLANYLPATAED
jgi:DNA-binding transcriptional LysR family regulator